MATICRQCKWHRSGGFGGDVCAHGANVNQITGHESTVICADKRGRYNPTTDCPDYESKAALNLVLQPDDWRVVGCQCGYVWAGSRHDTAMFEVMLDEHSKCPQCGGNGYYLRRKVTNDGD